MAKEELDTFGGITFEAANTLRETLIARRVFLGLSQKEVAERAGVAQVSISKWERQGYMSMRALDFLKMLFGYNIEPNTIAAMLGLLRDKSRDEAEKNLRLETINMGLTSLSDDDLSALIQIMRGWMKGREE